MKTKPVQFIMYNILLASSSRAFVRNNLPSNRLSKSFATSTNLFSTASETDQDNNNSSTQNDSEPFAHSEPFSPWDPVRLAEKVQSRNNAFRSRQHVNPLSAKFQQPTVLTPNWPYDTYDDLSKPLFLDIGCSRGGFLIDMATTQMKQQPGDATNNQYLEPDYNYLGLEIRPIVVYHAQKRIEKREDGGDASSLKGKLGFVGCNANVDLERLLQLLQDSNPEDLLNLQMVTIQFPDPHFKARHAKRRVVRPELVTTLAKFMPPGSTVWLQSDIQSVLDDMRFQFRLQSQYFQDSISPEIVDINANDDNDNDDESEAIQLDYVEENLLGVRTEREISVLERDLPVYRALFTRTDAQFSSD
ncbi:unnamed protein product [Cylindrotheca closterium]|uniref:tRNA (guanine(46)-N(7))-methyltransferase n=1 Tax=Cylindrotheca closterium TaxID=2856 RepID=A0AAD2G9I4_9STRA|nr:unnamed protein product [Cylindrotheca closterium]